MTGLALTLRKAGRDSALGIPESWSCVVARRVAKQVKVADWQITRITGKGMLHLGQVQAADADAAIRLAMYS
jgi:hypothetical protein